MPSIKEEEEEVLTFPGLFSGILDMVRRLDTSGDLQIRLMNDVHILGACKDFFEDQDQTGGVCVVMLNATFPEQHFYTRVFEVQQGHFDLVFVGRTMELHMKSYTLVNPGGQGADFCVDVHLVALESGSTCCVVV